MDGADNRKHVQGFDLVALGELLIDFTECGTSQDGRRLFEQNPGGAVANVSCCASRLGMRTAFIGKVGQDMHGEFLAQTLRGEGVDTRGLIFTGDAFTTLAFVALSADGERSFSFARKPGADMTITQKEINMDLLSAARVFHVGSLSLTDEPAASATVAALEHAKAAGSAISYDPNYRASLWRSEEEASARMRSVLPFVDLLKISEEETLLMTGHAEADRAARSLVAAGIPCVAVTLGAAGTLVCTKEGPRKVAGFSVPAIDLTGAGDAFWGGFLTAFIRSGKPVSELTTQDAAAFARYANACAAVCVTKRGGIPAMPTPEEVWTLIEK
jgi:fructokinase